MHLVYLNFMKHLILIAIIFITLSCKSQDQFTIYLSNFRDIELPKTIDRRYPSTQFYQNNTYKEINQPFVKKFICKDPVTCDTNASQYRYDYGIRFAPGDYQAAVINKINFEGNPDCDFDLSELILLVYSPQGEIISEQIIGKNNDCWISSTQLTSKNIEVQQIKILEFNKPEMSCEIEEKVYQISKSGIITSIGTEPIKKGIVIWDEQIEDFRLK